MEENEKYMRRALELAALARGRTSPNPMVGAVLVKDGAVVAEGRHRAAGQPHAEIEAFRAAGENARGCTLYVNLEPCSHFGRTPPCAPAVVDAGVSRVVVGMKDPNPLVAGRGISMLREAGLDVAVGVLEKECRRLNEVFVKHITSGQPFVLLKGAMTLDGKIASPSGDSKWISSAKSRELVHRLRGEVDAVMVGVDTLIADDASLTCRIPDKIKDPFRIVMDGRLRTPEHSGFCRLAKDGKSVIVTTTAAPEERAARLETLGCRLVRTAPDPRGRPLLLPAMFALAEMGIVHIMVEGGGELNFSLLKAGLVDKVMVFIAPRFLGGRDSRTLVEGDGFASIADGAVLKDISVSRIEEDILVTAYISPGEAG